MGTDYSAVIVVGLPQEDFEDKEQLEVWQSDFPSIIDCCPYYPDCWEDEDIINGIIVYRSEGGGGEPFVYDQQKIDEAILKFKDLTGLSPNVYLTPRIM